MHRLTLTERAGQLVCRRYWRRLDVLTLACQHQKGTGKNTTNLRGAELVKLEGGFTEKSEST